MCVQKKKQKNVKSENLKSKRNYFVPRIFFNLQTIYDDYILYFQCNSASVQYKN